MVVVASCVSVYRWQSEKKERILAGTSMARVMIVKQTNKFVVFLGRHDSDPIATCVCLEMLRGTERETDERSDEAKDEQDG